MTVVIDTYFIPLVIYLQVRHKTCLFSCYSYLLVLYSNKIHNLKLRVFFNRLWAQVNIRNTAVFSGTVGSYKDNYG